MQQLQAGKVWTDGLESGIAEAEQLVLVVSKAALDSPYTQEEWRGVADKGRQVVLAIYEPVELPEELRSLPSYDFRSGFDNNLQALAAFLKADGEPRQDRVPSPNRLGISTTLPGALWCTVATLFGALIAGLLGLILAVVLNPAEPSRPGGAGTPLSDAHFFWFMIGLAGVTGARYAAPLLRHKLEYKKVKRGVLVAIVLLIPMYFAVGTLADSQLMIPLYPAIAILVWILFVYTVMLRRSAGLLRWMQPEEALQKLRRRVHQPLVDTATFDVDTAAKHGVSVSYAIHADPADQPWVRFIEGIFHKAGHTRVVATENPEHHIAILSNRSSEAWAQEVARAHIGNLVFVVASTIEFKESLTAIGRLQWVDVRDGDRRDVASLARTLGAPGAWQREAALETTPAMIDHWKVPSGITLLKRAMELFGTFVLVFGLTDLVGFVMTTLLGSPAVATPPSDLSAPGDGNLLRSSLLVVVGATCFWLTSKALVYRQVTAPVVYGFLAVSLFLVSWRGKVLPDFLEETWWLAPAVFWPLMLYSALTSHFWLPSTSKPNPDEVGIKKSIDRAFQRRNLIVLSLWVIVIVGIAVSIMFTTQA